MIWQEATSHHPSRQQMHSSSSSESIATGEDSIVAVGLVWPISTNERSLHCILHSCILFLYNGPALSYPQNCPFLCGNTDLLEPTWVESPHPKCHLDWFHHFYVAHQYAQHADIQTMLHDIYSNRLHLWYMQCGRSRCRHLKHLRLCQNYSTDSSTRHSFSDSSGAIIFRQRLQRD